MLLSEDQLTVTRINAAGSAETVDNLATEEPLEIRLEYGPAEIRQVRNVSVTMRTPGNDADLAIGFLFTEGVISAIDEVAKADEPLVVTCAGNRGNTMQVSLKPGVEPNLNTAERNFYTTSSCGVCGKSSISAIHTVRKYGILPDDNCINKEMLWQIPDVLRNSQEIFRHTGGLHASALFSPGGELLLVREDVGRHNALDKLIGAALKLYWLPLNKHVLLLSGRASFELVQKAAMVGINIIAAIGAPSTLAVELAARFGITLIGFLRGQSFNIYTSPERIK